MKRRHWSRLRGRGTGRIADGLPAMQSFANAPFTMRKRCAAAGFTVWVPILHDDCRDRMKTTLDISDPLLVEAKKLAAHEGTTLRALVEQGLRHIVADRKLRKPPFRLRKASFKGRGLRAQAANAGWDRLRELAYEGRGS